MVVVLEVPVLGEVLLWIQERSSAILKTLGILTTSKGCWVSSSLKTPLYPQSALLGKAVLGNSCSWAERLLKQCISSLSNLILAMLL